MTLEIAARGGNLALLARREDLLNEIVDEARKRNVQAVAAAADVRDAKAVREAADGFRKELGPIDILLANAGGPPSTMFETTQQWFGTMLITSPTAGRLREADRSIMPGVVELAINARPAA